jgi:methylated-DNA-[protein]-cysteine S-methyltransferase
VKDATSGAFWIRELEEREEMREMMAGVEGKEMGSTGSKGRKVSTAFTPIYWGVVHLQGCNFVMAATDEGLGYLQFQDGDARDGVDEQAWLDFSKWARKLSVPGSWLADEARLLPYMQQLDEYLKGERAAFTLPLDLQGTTFQQNVWAALNNISHGETISYSQVAQTLDKSSAVRAVGTAIGANPVLIVVPCHRVVGKSGALTGYRGGLGNKEKLLRLEKKDVSPRL